MNWLGLLAAKCAGSSNFLGFPNWYRNLECDADGGPKLSGLGDIWKVVANFTEIALRVAALAAIIFVIIGGFLYITSSGEPEKTARAKNVISNAIIGLLISIFATAIVSFIARSF